MRLVRFLWRTSAARVVGASVVGAASGVAGTWLLKLAYDALSGTEGLGVPFLVGCAAMFGLRVVAEQLLATMAQGAVAQLRVELAARVVATPLPRLEQLGAGTLFATLSEDVASVSTAAPCIPMLLTESAVLLGSLVWLASLSLPLFGITLGFLLFGLVTYQVLAGPGVKGLERARIEQDALYVALRGSVEGAKDLQLHAGRGAAFLADVLAPATDRVRRELVRATTWWIVAGSWGITLFFVAIGVLLFLAPPSLAPPATRMAFVLAILYLSSPLNAIMSSLPTLGRAEVALAKVESLRLSLEPGVVNPPAAGGFRSLRLEGARYAHTGEDPFAVGPIDLEIRPGELVFIVGGNGSGKTTLVKMLSGLYPLSEGRRVLDDTHAPDEGAWRQLFGAVFADSWLFDRVLGHSPDPVETTARLEALGLADKVRVVDGGFSTTQLSTGQRRRLMLLCALVEDRPVYLFDEWAADQDPAFREEFYRNILPGLRARGRAVVVVSHDDRYFGVADRVVRMERGRIVGIERGEEGLEGVG